MHQDEPGEKENWHLILRSTMVLLLLVQVAPLHLTNKRIWPPGEPLLCMIGVLLLVVATTS